MSTAVRRPRQPLSSRDDATRIGTIKRATYFAWKDYFGRCLALVLLVMGIPVLLAAMLVVRLTSRGPAIFRQQRVGLNGRVYTMYKIRTMRQDAEVGTGPVWTVARDPRITLVGRFLRRFHIDEFPQLVNVLKGEMALIGPRPERPEFTQKLAVELPNYLDRLLVRPGITGLAQINLPPDTDLESVRRKLVLDLEYVVRGCLPLDLRIFTATFLRLLALPSDFSLTLLGLRRNPESQLCSECAATVQRNEDVSVMSMGALSSDC